MAAASKKSSRTIGVLAAGLAAFAGLAAWAAPDPVFDGGVDAKAALAAAREAAADEPGVIGKYTLPDPGAGDGAIWVSVGRTDIIQPSWIGSPLGSPVLTSPRAAVYRMALDRLPELSHFMHEKFGRCGGYFAHESKQDAEADLAGQPASQGGPYTLDQEAVVKPLVSLAKETELRSTIETLAAYQNRFYQADTGVSASSWIRDRWQGLAGGLKGASASLVAHAAWKQPSVVLTIPGSEKPDEYVVLGGHLDSIAGWGGSAGARAPGADDNASGIAVLTEVVRILGEGKFRPKRTVQVMGYAAEEVGLRGSKEIAQRYQSQGKKVVGVIQFDMTNFKGSPDAVYLLDDNVDPELTAFLGRLVDAYLGIKWSMTRCGYGCSDHASWTRSGFPASAAFESSFNGMNRNIHTDRDTLANSGGSAEHSVNFAKLGVAFAVELAKTAEGKKAQGSGR